MSASRGCLIFTNLLTFLVSLPILASGLLIRFYGQTRCSSYVQGPVLTIGILLFMVSLIGMIGSCCRVKLVLILYLCVMFLVVITMMFFSLGTVTVLPMRNQKDVNRDGLPTLREYPSFLRDNLIDEHHWVGIKSCLIETKVCSGAQKSWTWSKSLSPIQVGCCNPPSQCGYDLMNNSHWEVARRSMPINSEYNDCRTWKNEYFWLCYDCDSCKAGFLERIRNEWMTITTVLNFLIAYLIINFLIACYTFTTTTTTTAFTDRPRQGDNCT